jgi:4-deoxy-L-threo-5-hexosulose-uronate ketol-isomerase
MRTFNGPGPSEFARLNTQEIRRDFLIDGLFEPGRIHLAATGLDRLIAGGIVPETELALEAAPELRARHFHERRETGIINIGSPGRVVVDGSEYVLGTRECLYIGMGARETHFASFPGAQAAYYLLSCPAHRSFPTRLVTQADAAIVEIGDKRTASRRRIVRYIHEHGVQSCQLVMGYTELAEGSVWNTWPTHTHARRSEVYLYFDCNGGMITHLLGIPTETRHVIVRDREAVLSPSWSIHTGVGTCSYRFVWGMAGENRTFDDMDPIDQEVFA